MSARKIINSETNPLRRVIELAVRKAFPVTVQGSYGDEIHRFDAETGKLIADFLEENWAAARRDLEPWVHDAVHEAYRAQGYNVFANDAEVIDILIARIVSRLSKAQ